MRFRRIAAIALCLIATVMTTMALSQSSPDYYNGQVLTAAQLNAAFAGKQDAFGSSYIFNGAWSVNGQLIGGGTTTNDNAMAGQIGEFLSSNVPSGSAVALTTATAADVTTLSLTAGDWDVSGNVALNPAATTSVTQYLAWITTSSATVPTSPNAGAEINSNFSAFVPNATEIMPVGTIRISVGVTTTVYLSVRSTFTVSTMGAYGYLRARRVR